MSEAILDRPRHLTPGACDGLRPGRVERLLKWLPLVLTLTVALAVTTLYALSAGFHAETSHAMSVLASGDGEAIRAYLLSFGAWAPVISVLLMLLQAVATPVPSALVVFANGLAFGVFWGGLLSLFGQTLAATACFWFARSLGRKPVEALAGKLGLTHYDRWFSRWGVTGILVSRLIPGLSFDAVSYASGLTGIRFWRFLAATAAGIAPQSFLYAYLILRAPQYAWLMLASSILVAIGIAIAAFVHGRSAMSMRLDR